MKKVSLLLLGFCLFSTSARAEVKPYGTRVPVLACSDARNMADAGLSLQVYRIVGMKHFEIDFAEGRIYGEQKLGTVKVRQILPNPRLAGAPTVYAGNGVRLAVNFTTAPIDGRYARGRVEGKLPTQTLAHDLKCEPIASTM